MAYDELELDRIGDRKTAVFFIISDTTQTYNFLVALAFSQMFNLLCERADNVHGGRLPHHVRVLWDEAANTGQVPQLEKLVAVIRSREVSLCLLYQQLAQCKAIYDKHAETILGNMDSVVFLGGREASTIKEISENWLGKATISMQTDSRSRGQSESYSQNTQRLGRELMTPAELATMPGDKCILQLRGLPPFFSPKYDLKRHPNYRYTAEADKQKNAFDLDRLINRRRRPGLNEACTMYEVTVPDDALTEEDEDILNYDDMPKMNSKYFAYASKSFDFALMAGVIALVLIGGYIVIQSIFRISINDKIQSYGQLRTIGATPKQIKRIVKNEGRKLGSIGILIGTVLGVCGGFLLFSKGFNAVSYVATVILTLISSWIMISVSIRKPVKIAAGISPIEAVRFTPAQKDIRSRKKNIKLNPVSMGIANFRRDRKKTVAIVASLSLGGIILLVVSSIVLLRSPEALARRFFPDGDYKIYLDSEMTEEKVMAAGNPLNEELKQEILSIDGVTDIIPSRQSLYATLKTDIYQSGGMCDMLTDQNYATVEAALTAGTMPKDSRSIVIDYNVLKQNEDMGVGSTVDFYFGEGQPPVSVTVSGLFDSNKTPSGHGKLALDGVLFFAPEALFHELHPEIASFDYSWSIVNDPKKTDYVGAELKNIVASHSNIALDEINTVIEYEEMTNSFAFGSMEILSWLVFLFGVINLINTTLSNQIARKQERPDARHRVLHQKYPRHAQRSRVSARFRRSKYGCVCHRHFQFQVGTTPYGRAASHRWAAASAGSNTSRRRLPCPVHFRRYAKVPLNRKSESTTNPCKMCVPGQTPAYRGVFRLRSGGKLQGRWHIAAHGGVQR